MKENHEKRKKPTSKIKCKECPAAHVEEIRRTAGQRMSEHQTAMVKTW